jgi:hypothetical protein
MPSFKPKTVKKIKVNKKNSTTLDGKHREYINEFNKNDNDKIPKLKHERLELRNKLELLCEGQKNYIEEKLDIQDQIEEITKKLHELKNKKKDYYLDNSKFIFEYFENKKSISKNETAVNTNTKSKILNNFFKIKNDIVQNDQVNKNIVHKYLCNIDESFLDINNYLNNTDVCSYCNEGELIPLDDEGVLICNSCFKNVPFLIENEKPSYKEPPKEVCFYAYKKINHFKEILAQYQGKETTQIHPEVIENIKQQIKKERIKLEDLTYNKLKEILKKLSYNKHYEHIQFIKNKLGIKPPVFTPEFEDTLCNLFNELLSPYSKFCPNDRVNFLNYYYVLYKLCESLGETRYLHEIPMLKDREKIIEQDEIWKRMCVELNWSFIPTI